MYKDQLACYQTQKSKKLANKPIYKLVIIDFEAFKTCIKTYLANDFIKPLKFLAKTLIIFIKNLDKNFYFSTKY